MLSRAAILFCGWLLAWHAPPVTADDAPAHPLKLAEVSLMAIDLNQQTMGSAICVDERGYFITSRRLLGDMNPGGRVRGMLLSGRRDARAMEAKVVSLSDADDLALLRVSHPGEAKLKAWPLADDADLKDGLAVTVVGHPLFHDRAAHGRDFPAAAGAAGKISAVNVKKSEPIHLQTDVEMNAGYVGGALVDVRGRLAGMVLPNASNVDPAVALPVNRVRHFLTMPVLIAHRPILRFSDRFAPATFEFELLQIVKTDAKWTAELSLSDGLKSRAFPMKAQGDRFTCEAEPLPRAERPFRLLAIARINGRQFKGQLEDRAIKIGAADIRLTEVRRIERRLDSTIVHTTERRKLVGTVAGLGEMEVKGVGKIKLEEAQSLSLAAAEEVVPAVEFEARLLRGKELIASTVGAISFEGAPAPADQLAKEELTRGEVDEIVIDALVDGKSDLFVRDGGIHWSHDEHAKPGVLENGVRHVFVNGVRWNMKWIRTQATEGKSDDSEALAMDIGTPDFMYKLISISKERNGPSQPIGLINFYDYPREQLITIHDYGPGATWYKFRLIRRDAIRRLKVQVKPDIAETQSLLRELNPGDADVLAPLKRMELVRQLDAADAALAKDAGTVRTVPGSLARTVVVGKRYFTGPILTGPGFKLPVGRYLAVFRLAALDARSNQLAYVGVDEKDKNLAFRIVDGSETPRGQWTSVAVEFNADKDLEQVGVYVIGYETPAAIDRVYFFKTE